MNAKYSISKITYKNACFKYIYLFCFIYLLQHLECLPNNENIRHMLQGPWKCRRKGNTKSTIFTGPAT